MPQNRSFPFRAGLGFINIGQPVAVAAERRGPDGVCPACGAFRLVDRVATCI
jgi:hypothetical protein